MSTTEHNQQKKRQKNKLDVLLGWGFGVFLLVTGFLELFSKPGLGLIALFTGLSVFPPLLNFVRNKWSFKPSAVLEIIIYFVLIVLVGVLSGQLTPPHFSVISAPEKTRLTPCQSTTAQPTQSQLTP